MPTVLRRPFYWLHGLEVVNAVTNPFDLWLPKLGLPRTISFASGVRFRVDRRTYPLVRKLVWLAYYGAALSTSPKPGHWTVDLGEDRITTPEGISFTLSNVGDPFVLAETFVYGTHFAGFDLGGRTVVDVGANIGDTALYFAAQGARVYAYEPDPENYAALLENLRRNPSRAIEPRPFAVGTDRVVRFRAGLKGGSGLYAKGGRAISVESRSLETILRDDRLDDPYLLKADCKGTEYELVQQDAIGRFHSVLIEFDAPQGGRDLAFLTGELRRRGFAHVRVFKHNWWVPRPATDHGIIHAER